jgi:hypothetical protein
MYVCKECILEFPSGGSSTYLNILAGELDPIYFLSSVVTAWVYLVESYCRFNMDLDLQSLFRVQFTAVLIG